MSAVRRSVFLALLALSACKTTRNSDGEAPLPSFPARRATLFITSELKGYVGPCGCSENMRGGIARAAFQIRQAADGGHPQALIDTGDALFGQATLPPEAVPQQELKAKVVGQALRSMGLSTRAVGPLDDARGAEFRTALGLPELKDGVARLELSGIELAVVAAPDAQGLASRAATERAKGARFVLGLWLGTLENAQTALEQLGELDFVVAARSKDELAGETNRLVRVPVPLAQPQSKGRSLLRLELTQVNDGRFALVRGAAEQERELAALDQRIERLRTQVNEPGLGDELKALRRAKLEEVVARRESLASAPPPEPQGKNAIAARFVPLEASFAEDPEVKALVTTYDREVGELNLAWAKANGKPCPAPAPNEGAYVGNARCADCHEDALTVWNATKHAHALPTLEAVGKQHHLDCIGCHVTGWQRPGGVCRLDLVAPAANVGCEACHGPGSRHAEDPDAVHLSKGDEPATCTGCHDLENSPHFDFEKYVAQVLGPGHGQPAPPKPPKPTAAPDAGRPAPAKRGK